MGRLESFFTKALAPAAFAAVKSAAITLGGDVPYMYGGFGSQQWPWLQPSTRVDYKAEAGEPTQSAIIMSCVFWVMRTFPEAPPRVVHVDGSKREPIDRHPMIELLRHPNPYYNGRRMLQALSVSWNLDGNAYLLKARNKESGTTQELWWEPHTTIRPVWDTEGREFIAGYQLMRKGQWLTEPEDMLPREDVIHLAYGMDPMNPRRGMSPLMSILREVYTDNEAANYTASILRNLGVPGVVFSPNGDYEIDDDEADALKASMLAKFTGDRRGEPLVSRGPVTMQYLSFSPEQMNLDKLRTIPEERITGVMGLPAIIAGMGAGLDHSIYNNMREAKAQAYENNLIPTQDAWAAQLQDDLLPDFDDAPGLEVEFDRSRVYALAEDQDALFSRVNEVWQSSLIKRRDAKGMLQQNLEIDDTEDDVYFHELEIVTETLTEKDNPGTLLPPDQRGQETDAPPGAASDGTQQGQNGAKSSAAAPAPAAEGKSLPMLTSEGKIGDEAVANAFGDLLDELEGGTV